MSGGLPQHQENEPLKNSYLQPDAYGTVNSPGTPVHTAGSDLPLNQPALTSSTSTPNGNDDPRKGVDVLHRGLSARQVQMIAIAGTIGTGLFLGTGRSLAEGGPASVLICYGLIGIIVYVTLLLLGEMATQYPIAGKCYFSTIIVRFI